MLCSKTDRKEKFKSASIDKFVLELEDVGHHIEKIRIGHDNSGFGRRKKHFDFDIFSFVKIGPAWHLDRVEIRRVLKGQKTNTYVFQCGRWFAKSEDDRAIVRELVPDKIIEEKLDKSGQLRVKERGIEHRLESNIKTKQLSSKKTFYDLIFSETI
jgi:hypothetical protein